MSSIRAISITLALLLASPAVSQTAVVLKASDGVAISGDSYAPAGAPVAVVLLFHQAGSNRGEYAPIAPVLAKQGYLALAIDQRSGGRMWGRDNETARTVGGDPGYVAALPDLEAALAHARKTWPGLPVAVWGSSYSASLVFLLAARHPGEISAVLAFSPGEYFGGRRVAEAAAQVRAPVFVTSASSPAEIAAAETILAASPASLKQQYKPKMGQHGSSTLREDSDPAGAKDNWAAVKGFLARVLPAP